MTGIHFNVEAVEAFCTQLTARRDALIERLGDERILHESVFDGWRDHRAQSVQARLEELTRMIETIASDMDDLTLALRQQVRAAHDYLGGAEGW